MTNNFMGGFMLSNDVENKALCLETKSLFIAGSSIKSLMIIFRTKGCSYAHKTGGCTHCSLSDNALDNITGKNLIAQFENCISEYKINNYQYIELLTLGSFLDEREMPEQAARHIFTYIRNNTHAQTVMIESRPEFINADKLYRYTAYLGGVRLEVGLGIESTNHYISSVMLKKGYSMDNVNDSLKVMSECDVGFVGYVLHKPVGLTEKEGIADSVETIKCIFDFGAKHNIKTRIALQPYYIARNSYSYQEYVNGRYTTPMLWSIIEVLKQTNHLGDISVALNDEGLTDGLVASNCKKCNSDIIREIKKYNYTNKIDKLMQIKCDCKKAWLDLVQ